MRDATTACNKLLTKIQDWVRRQAARVHRAGDATAAEHGWTVTPSAWGLVRTYRDPRFPRPTPDAPHECAPASPSLPGSESPR